MVNYPRSCLMSPALGILRPDCERAGIRLGYRGGHRPVCGLVLVLLLGEAACLHFALEPHGQLRGHRQQLLRWL